MRNINKKNQNKIKLTTFILVVIYSCVFTNGHAALGLSLTNAANDDKKLYSFVVTLRGVTDSEWQQLPQKIRLEDYALYAQPKKQSADATTYVVGFFVSRDASIATLQKIRKAFAKKIKLDVRAINKQGKVNLQQWLAAKTNKEKHQNLNNIDKELTLLMEQARQAMIKNDYRIAIATYSKVMRYEESDYYQAALEYLGLARERNNQLAHAKAEYERYLQRYPEGEASERVRQRLSGVISAAMLPRKKLKKYQPRGFRSDWVSVSSLTQSFRTDRDIETPVGENRVFSNAFSSYFYTATLKSRSFEFRNQISLSNNYDVEENDEENDLVKISYLYSESTFKNTGLFTRVGRQRHNPSGAFGRFDGAVVGYNFTDNAKFNVTSGYPVAFDSYDRIQEEKPFYSANIELESLFDLFDVNTYFITQFNDTLLDRQAVGLDIRYFDRNRMLYSTIDYDTSFRVINNFIFNVSSRINEGNSIGTYATFRRSPLLTTSNSLQGQFVGSLKELLEEKTEETIRQLARDRTAKYGSLTFNWKQHIRKNMEISHDYTISKLGGTVTSDGVSGFEGTGFEDFFSSQFIASDLWTKNDMLLVGLTHSIMDTSDRTALTILRRDQINTRLMLSTKFRTEYQERSNDSTVTIVKPAVKVNYRYTRKYKFESEIGLDRRIHENSFDEGVYQTMFFNLGYTAQF